MPVKYYPELGLLHLIESEIQEVANAYSPNTPAPINGYLTVRSASDGRIIRVREIGENPAEKFDGRCFNSQEKGKRLFENPNHDLSWQSRDPEKGKWGGAIRTPEFILSFSGLPELADETLMVLAAFKMAWLSQEEALAMLDLSGNDIGKKFFA